MRVMVMGKGESATSVSLAMRSAKIEVDAVSASVGAEAVVDYGFGAVVVCVADQDFDVVRAVRRAAPDMPLMAVVCDDSPVVEEAALDAGANGVVAVPAHADEIASRVRVLVRRVCGHGDGPVTCGRLVLDLDARTLRVSDAAPGTGPVALTAKEYEIVELMMLRRGGVVPKEMIMDHLYGLGDVPAPKIVDVFVCRIRKKIAKALGGDRPVVTLWGRGYAMRDGRERDRAAA